MKKKDIFDVKQIEMPPPPIEPMNAKELGLDMSGNVIIDNKASDDIKIPTPEELGMDNGANEFTPQQNPFSQVSPEKANISNEKEKGILRKLFVSKKEKESNFDKTIQSDQIPSINEFKGFELPSINSTESKQVNNLGYESMEPIKAEEKIPTISVSQNAIPAPAGNINKTEDKKIDEATVSSDVVETKKVDTKKIEKEKIETPNLEKPIKAENIEHEKHQIDKIEKDLIAYKREIAETSRMITLIEKELKLIGLNKLKKESPKKNKTKTKPIKKLENKKSKIANKRKKKK